MARTASFASADFARRAELDAGPARAPRRALADEHRLVGPEQAAPPLPRLGQDFPAVVELASLDGTNGFRIDGIDAFDRSGQSVASAGDINGDGFDDVIVGAYGADPNGDSFAGESYVVFGSGAGFAPTIDLATLDGSNGFRLDGIDADDASGVSVSSAGDIDGDGFDDIIIGALGAYPGGGLYSRNAGESYVVFGSDGGFAASLDLASLDGSNGFRIDGVDVDDNGGFSVSSAGDVNGDGFDDIIIGARYADPAGDGYAGESYVVFGKAGGFAASFDLAALDGSNGFRLDGVDTADLSGHSVSSAGDVNGDGFDDIVIGAYGGDPGGDSFAGESYVVFGSGGDFGASVNLASLDGSNGFRVDGFDLDDRSGASVASAGDVNGDGFDDLIIAAAGADPGGDLSAGESYVVFGLGDGFGASGGLASLDGSNGFRIDGIDPDDRSGVSVSAAGDVNGDGFDDIIIGAPISDPGGDTFAGESYVVFGKAGGFAASLDLASLDGSNGFRLDGIDAADRSGQAVSSAGDVNGDGFDDIIIGAPYAHPGGDSVAGESYVVFGHAGGFAASLDLASLDGSNGFRLDGIDVSDISGFSVASAGDVNGDGFDDVVIGAVLGDPGGDGAAGESYVVFGHTGGFAASLDLASLDGSNGFRIDGIGVDDRSGWSVSSAGDVNGDGFDDIIIGARFADSGGDSYAGESYVVFGHAGGFAASLDLASLNGSEGFRIEGIDANDYNGTAVSAAGDFNSDGFDDIVIGAPSADPNGDINAGESYLIFGRAPDSDVRRTGSAAGQAIMGGIGDDTLEGLGGGDTLRAQGGDDSLNGGSGDDRLEGGDGVDTLAGGSGDDTAIGGAGSDEASLGSGNDSADGGTGADTLRGSDGNDILTGGVGGDRLDGGEDRDLAVYKKSTAAVNVDLASGIGSGGHAAGDTLIAIENILGSKFADTLSGSADANLLRGDKADDTLAGRGGDDTLEGGAGGDALEGGDGADWASYAKSGQVRADLQTPANNTGHAAGDSFAGIENLLGGAANDTLRGDAGANELAGGQGDDSLLGRDGADILTGGGGADRFTLASADAAHYETIADFTGVDEIALTGSVYGLAAGALAPSAFRAGAAAGDAGDRIIYNQATGLLFFDADGNGAGAQVLIGALVGNPTLSAADFIVI